jgi:hypothetical protein
MTRLALEVGIVYVASKKASIEEGRVCENLEPLRTNYETKNCQLMPLISGSIEKRHFCDVAGVIAPPIP